MSDGETQFLQWNVLSLARTVETSALLQHLSESVQRPSETCTHCQAKFWSLQTCSSCEAEQRRGKAIERDGMDQKLKFKDDNPNSTNDITTYCQFGCWALEPASTGNPWHGLHSPRDPKIRLYRNVTVGSDPTAQKWSEVMLQRGNPWSPNQKEACSGNASNLGIKHWAPSKKKRYSSDFLRKWEGPHVWLTSPEPVPHSSCPSCWTSRHRKRYLSRTWQERSHAENLLVGRFIGSHASLSHGCNTV